MTTPGVPSWSLRRLLESAIWFAGGAVLALALLVATAELLALLLPAARAAVHELPVAVVLAILSGLGALSLVLALTLERRGHWAIAVGLGFAVLLAGRLAAIAVFPSPIVSDWKAYVELATGILDGLGFWSSRATGYPAVLAGAFAVGGRDPLAGELLNVVVAVVCGVLLVLLVRPRFGRPTALVTLFLYALVPSQLLFTVLLASETLYSAILVLVALLVTRLSIGTWRMAILVGVVFGLAQYVRPTSQYLLPAALAVLFLVTWPWRRAAGLAAVAVLTFLIVTGPIVAWNASVNHRLSVAPYLYDGWILYVGLSVDEGGQFNQEDDRRVWRATGLSPDGSPPQSLPGYGVPKDRFDDAAIALQRTYNEAAARLALERLRSNGIDTLLMQPAKFSELWRRSDQPVAWIFREATTSADAHRETLFRTLSQVGWVLVLAGAVAGVVSRRRRPIAVEAGSDAESGARPSEMTVVLVLVLATTVIHTLAQVNDRFHEYLVPLLCVLAAIGYVDLAARLRRRNAAAPLPGP